MKNLIATMGAFALGSMVLAQSAVEWRVADGGNGHWYQRVVEPSTWAAARIAAETRGGHLATITSQGEQNFLTAIGSAEFWLGGFAPANQGCGPAAWAWVTGEPMSYIGWASGEPGTCSHTCMAFAIWGGYTGRWNNDICSRPDAPGYMAEWSADCNNDGLVDYGQILAGQLIDANGNNIPDTCEGAFASATTNPGSAPATTIMKDFDMGEGLSVGIRLDGSLVAWGAYSVTPPTGGFTQISVGRNCAIGIRVDGSLAGFGANEQGRLNLPAGTFTCISAADATWHAAAVRSDGAAICWGYNNHGQCIAPVGSFREIAAGGHEVWSGFTVAVRADGSLAAWGNNAWGQRNVPVGSNFCAVAAGYYHALALRQDGTIAGWGFNQNGQSTPPAGTFVSISCGSNESLAVRSDGTVATFGGVPASVIAFFSAKSDVVKAQLICCGGATALSSSDCDNNGLMDPSEISVNASLDQNANAVLDRCEASYDVPQLFPTIQAAIDATPIGVARTITVAPGTFLQSFSMNGKNVVVRGAPNNATILDGTGLTTSIARFTGGEPATAGVENLVFRNGTSGSRFTPTSTFTIGGAIYADATSAFIRNCRFENCRADYGGAIYQRSGTLAWDNCAFVGNIANDEGGGALVYNCSGTISASTFTGNRCGINGAGSGSGFKAVGSNGNNESVILEGCTLTGNIAGDSGAAVEFYQHTKFLPGVLRLITTTITGNTSGQPFANGAGGLRVLGDQTSCVISAGSVICSNTASQVAGPYLVAGTVTICDCAGDLTGDGSVNGGDLGVLLTAWGAASSAGTGDANHDGVVDGSDLAIVLTNWGPCAP